MNLELLIADSIRRFDWCKHDVHFFHDLDEDVQVSWPESLAAEIVKNMVVTKLRADS